MGNILTQERHNRAGEIFDDLEYHYQKDANGNLLRNRLYSVSDDPTLASIMEDDIEDMDPFISAINQINTHNNYSYDAEGRLVKDKQEEIDTILWTVSGKVKEIHRSLQSTKKNLIFEYAKSMANPKIKARNKKPSSIQLTEIQHVINKRPRKKLYYQSPKEIFYNFINRNYGFVAFET